MRAHPVVTFSLLWLALAGLPTAAAAAAAVEDRCERLVATGNPQYPPYLWRDPQNPEQLIGANADLLKQLAESLGLTVEVLYSGPWARAQQEVRSGRIDLLVGAFLTPRRLESMDYVHPPLYELPISSEALHLTLSHNSACNEPWLRGQLAKKMFELSASGVPERLLELNVERWKVQQSQPSSTEP